MEQDQETSTETLSFIDLRKKRCAEVLEWGWEVGAQKTSPSNVSGRLQGFCADLQTTELLVNFKVKFPINGETKVHCFNLQESPNSKQSNKKDLKVKSFLELSPTRKNRLFRFTSSELSINTIKFQQPVTS